MRHAMRKPIYKHKSSGRVKEIKQYAIILTMYCPEGKCSNTALIINRFVNIKFKLSCIMKRLPLFIGHEKNGITIVVCIFESIKYTH